MKIPDLVFHFAVKNLNANPSARLCLADARAHQAAGEIDLALFCALRSISHSVGILHPDYRHAFEVAGFSGECRLVSSAITPPGRAETKESR
jgi:hypothetical protein